MMDIEEYDGNDENDLNGDNPTHPRTRTSLDETSPNSSELPVPGEQRGNQSSSSLSIGMPSSMLQCALLKAIHDADNPNCGIPVKDNIQGGRSRSWSSSERYERDDTSTVNAQAYASNVDPSPIPTTRMVVEGPSQCGKTSLAMDFAYSVASSSPTSTVIFFVPEKKRSILDFPLSCRGKYASYNKHGHGHGHGSRHGVQDEHTQLATSNCEELDDAHQMFLESMKAMNALHEDEKQDHNRDEDRIPRSPWDSKENDKHKKNALDRIHVRYIKSAFDLVQCLATIQHSRSSTFAATKMVNAIVVDDLDYYVCQEPHNADDTREDNHSQTAQDMKLIQLLAVLSDTCHYLDEAANKNNHDYSQHETNFVACLNSDRLQKANSLYQLIQNYAPTVVTIAEEKMDDVNASSIFVQENDRFQCQPKCFSIWSMSLQHIFLPLPDTSLRCRLRTNFFIGASIDGDDGKMGVEENGTHYDYEDDERELYWKL